MSVKASVVVRSLDLTIQACYICTYWHSSPSELLKILAWAMDVSIQFKSNKIVILKNKFNL